MTYYPSAKRPCSGCKSVKAEIAFDRSPSTGRLYRVCRLCKAAAKDKRDRKANRLTNPEKREALWRAHYPKWQSYGYSEATTPLSAHGCRRAPHDTRLNANGPVKDNEFVVYCDNCLTLWRTGEYDKMASSKASLTAAAERRYRGAGIERMS